MRGRLTASTKILRRAHQSSAKQLLPKPVHRDTAGERVLEIRDPGGQPKPASRRIRRKRRESAWGSTLDLDTRLVVISTDQHKRGTRSSPLAEDQGRGRESLGRVPLAAKN